LEMMRAYAKQTPLTDLAVKVTLTFVAKPMVVTLSSPFVVVRRQEGRNSARHYETLPQTQIDHNPPISIVLPENHEDGLNKGSKCSQNLLR